jgi:hypothetical protein
VDQLSVRRRRVDLGARQVNERIECVAFNRALIAPDGRDQRAARHDPAGSMHQEGQEVELPAAELDHFCASRHLIGGLVDREVEHA